MKNFQNTLGGLILLSFLFLFSCSKELTPEEKLEGFWIGEVLQEGLGTLEITLDFNQIELNQPSGTWTTKDKDFSNCDSQIYICESFSCSGALVFNGSNNEILNFSLNLSSGPCFENSTSQISFIDDNTINYSNTPQGGSSISGVFKRR